MNYETYIKEGHQLKTLHKLNKLTKKKLTYAQRDLRHNIDSNIFYPRSAWPPSNKEILKHDTITYKNTFKLILFAYGNGKRLHKISLHVDTPSKLKKRAHQIQWII